MTFVGCYIISCTSSPAPLPLPIAKFTLLQKSSSQCTCVQIFLYELLWCSNFPLHKLTWTDHLLTLSDHQEHLKEKQFASIQRGSLFHKLTSVLKLKLGFSSRRSCFKIEKLWNEFFSVLDLKILKWINLLFSGNCNPASGWWLLCSGRFTL